VIGLALFYTTLGGMRATAWTNVLQGGIFTVFMVTAAVLVARSLGPESFGHSLTTAEAPDLELPDVNGEPWTLEAMAGRKVLLVAWASW